MSWLFKTKLRKKLLAHFFTHVDENYYVRELASLIDEDAGNLSRELKDLEKEGIFASHIKGGAKYYSLNKKYPLFAEIKNIIFKTEGVEGSLRNIINGYKDISLSFIYGSYARKDEKKTSDVDIILVRRMISRDEILSRFIRDLHALESKLNREINITSFSEKEFRDEAKKEGGFLNLILKDKVIILKGNLNV